MSRAGPDRRAAIGILFEHVRFKIRWYIYVIPCFLYQDCAVSSLSSGSLITSIYLLTYLESVRLLNLLWRFPTIPVISPFAYRSIWLLFSASFVLL